MLSAEPTQIGPHMPPYAKRDTAQGHLFCTHLDAHVPVSRSAVGESAEQNVVGGEVNQEHLQALQRGATQALFSAGVEPEPVSHVVLVDRRPLVE